MNASHKSLLSIYLAAWRSLSLFSWLLTAMWPSVNPCVTQSS
ncbi:hypothetical protein A6R68_24086 [Neotoma lepida]|uniref:Uncharacterized protein n=1 Tax=Neotoma lepida TaxID=56216 RepID=A0A1A6HML3_NEOLE|nr:hypothetical protein A6R68_22125 [Neotoma lepida]OBS81925.1 hypothetical protein A6R68_24086 [Neotoma lepida]